MPLNPEEMTVLRALAEPIEQRRRADFMQEVTRRLEATPVVGAGTARHTRSDELFRETFSIRPIFASAEWDQGADVPALRIRS
jgi:hypothetical protein